MIEIREEKAVDVAGIDKVNALAFGRRDEAELVARLRQNKKISLSLVAVRDGKVVGHALFTPMRIVTASGTSKPAVGVGPVAVLPDLQRQGIGAALMKEGLAKCQQAGHAVVFVLGHPTYYPRFGFRRAADFGLRFSYDEPDDAFMVLELQPGSLENVSGTAYYEPEFDGV